MRIVPYIVVIVIFGALAVGYFTHRFKQFTASSPSSSIVSSASPEVIPEESTLQSSVSANIPPDWKLYTSPNGYKLSYPSDMDNDVMSEGERFYKLGPTQSRGTELYDGISLLIRTGDLADLTLQELTNQKHSEIKKQETIREVTDPTPISYGKHKAIQFRQSGFGDGDYIYIQMPGKKYLEIIDMTVEPQNREQTYQKIVKQMIGSITF